MRTYKNRTRTHKNTQEHARTQRQHTRTIEHIENTQKHTMRTHTNTTWTHKNKTRTHKNIIEHNKITQEHHENRQEHYNITTHNNRNTHSFLLSTRNICRFGDGSAFFCQQVWCRWVPQVGFLPPKKTYTFLIIYNVLFDLISTLSLLRMKLVTGRMTKKNYVFIIIYLFLPLLYVCLLRFFKV